MHESPEPAPSFIVDHSTFLTCALAVALGACGGGDSPGTQRLPSVSSLTVPAGLAAGTKASFSLALQDPDRLVSSVSWTFGDGNSTNDASLVRNGDAATSTVVHTYLVRGDYNVAASATVTGSTPLQAGAAASVSGPATGCALHDFKVTTPDFYFAYDGIAGENPVITVCAGETFTFHLANVSPMHPFCIWNAHAATEAPGVVRNCMTGTVDVVWQVPSALADGARYICEVHYFGNVFTIR